MIPNIEIGVNLAVIPHSERTRIINACQGYFYLGLYKEALNELDKIEAPEDIGIDILVLRIDILIHLKKWNQVEKMTKEYILLYPNVVDFAIQRTFVLKKLNRGNHAATIGTLISSEVIQSGLLNYRIACYEASFGNWDAAKKLLEDAIRINKKIKKLASIDPKVFMLL